MITEPQLPYEAYYCCLPDAERAALVSGAGAYALSLMQWILPPAIELHFVSGVVPSAALRLDVFLNIWALELEIVEIAPDVFAPAYVPRYPDWWSGLVLWLLTPASACAEGCPLKYYP